MKLYRPIVI